MNSTSDNVREPVVQTLSASMKPASPHRAITDRLPERFKDGEDGDDSQLDYTAPPRGMGFRDGQVHYMQQSLFSVIAAVGSKSDFRARFDDSSDSEEEQNENLRKESRPLSSSNRHQSRERTELTPQGNIVERGRRHRRTISDNKLVQKLQGAGSKGKEPNPSTALRPSSLSLSPRRTRSMTPRAAPVLARMVQAQNRFDTASITEDLPSTPQTIGEDKPETSGSALSERLMDMFGFDRPEKVLVEYACALLQSILLQGYMYVTEGHICFYAYLPKRSSVVTRSGYISKRGRKNPKYTRYWFVLKGDVFSYYANSSNLYFPSGHVDLRYGISASLAKPKSGDDMVKDFYVTTDQRTYFFRADSAASAKEWVKSLQNVIFRTHNEGDSVKISFPIANVIDLEESPMAEFAETFKIRVVDSGETFAIDEVRSSPRILSRLC